MIKFKIEKKVAMPTKRANHFFPFAEMIIGDSFFVPKGAVSNSVLYSVISQQKAKHSRVFTSRAIKGGRRVWRVA